MKFFKNFFFIFVLFSCHKLEKNETQTSLSPPETSEAKYDIPSSETGFSPSEPIGHCTVMTGFDLNKMKVYLSDPGNNKKSGHVLTQNFDEADVTFIKDYCTVRIEGKFATVTGAIVISPPVENLVAKGSKDIFIQSKMPDFSQHAVQGWECYCAPTSGANIVYYFSHFFEEFKISSIFKSSNIEKRNDEWSINKLIGGTEAPFPHSFSLAYRMETTLSGGTTMLGIQSGMRSFIDQYSINQVNGLLI